jgi:hypothetical protein
MRQSKTRGEVLLTGRIAQEDDGFWYAYCDELGVTAFAATLPDSLKQFLNVVRAYFNAAEKIGKLDDLCARLERSTGPARARLAIPGFPGATVDVDLAETC